LKEGERERLGVRLRKDEGFETWKNFEIHPNLETGRMLRRRGRENKRERELGLEKISDSVLTMRLGKIREGVEKRGKL